uniref:uncharacterized protein LOC120334023 n=1 Tax=Styela clava TaxID=7725 RepID=UPI00193A7EBE|nr:uncharacterized protein LOC120334023 [Styela clava]
MYRAVHSIMTLCVLYFIFAKAYSAPSRLTSSEYENHIRERNMASQRRCVELYSRLSYAMWKHVCGPRTPHAFVRRVMPSMPENPNTKLDQYKDDTTENSVRLQELISGLNRQTRDGGIQYDAPLYII